MDIGALQGVVDGEMENLIICGDFNARSEIGFDTFTDGKGQSLEEFMLANNLHLGNEPGFPPIFKTINGTSCVDVTLADDGAIDLLSDWKVTEDLALSDYRTIRFILAPPGAARLGVEGEYRTVFAGIDSVTLGLDLEELCRELMRRFLVLVAPARIEEALEELYERLN